MSPFGFYPAINFTLCIVLSQSVGDAAIQAIYCCESQAPLQTEVYTLQ